MATIHLIKLVVGVPDLPSFIKGQERWLIPYKDGMAHPVWTRHRPKRAEELLEGGSLYRVIKNRIQCRQIITGFEEIMHEEKGRMCMIMTDPAIIPTRPVPKRAFQGWRYLKPEDAPPDSTHSAAQDEGNTAIAAELAALGLL